MERQRGQVFPEQFARESRELKEEVQSVVVDDEIAPLFLKFGSGGDDASLPEILLIIQRMGKERLLSLFQKQPEQRVKPFRRVQRRFLRLLGINPAKYVTVVLRGPRTGWNLLQGAGAEGCHARNIAFKKAVSRKRGEQGALGETL